MTTIETHERRGIPGSSGNDADRGISFLLKHVHLTKSDDADVIEYDPEKGTVTLSRNADDLKPSIGFIRTGE